MNSNHHCNCLSMAMKLKYYSKKIPSLSLSSLTNRM